MGGGWEMGVKYGRLPEKTGVLTGMMSSHMSYSSCSCFCLLDRTIQICVSCFRGVKNWLFE